MGTVVIELPLQVNLRFRITDAEVAAKVVEQLEGLTQNDAEQADVTDDEILSVWADHAESPDEIARGLRQRNRQPG